MSPRFGWRCAYRGIGVAENICWRRAWFGGRCCRSKLGCPVGIELLIILFVFLFSMLIPLVISFLIYRDSKTRGSQHALAWGFGSVF